MRVFVMLGVVAASGNAIAGDSTCYAGKETSDFYGSKEDNAIIVVREVDRASHVIRERTWSDADVDSDRTWSFHVAPQGQTFDLESSASADRGTGTLNEDWTAYRAKVEIGKRLLTWDAKLDDRSFESNLRGELDHKVVDTRRIAATAFDCKELPQRLRALDPNPASAVRRCYAGTQTADPDHVFNAIVVQTISDRRIELRERVGKMKTDRIYALTPSRDGKFMVDAITPVRLVGKAKAWTGYAWSETSKLYKKKVEGTLGGDHATRRLVVTTDRTMTVMLEADVFDCKQLAKRRTALAAAPE